MSNMQSISITLKCAENNGCFYDGKDMPILIAIKNEGKININFPFEFLRKSGPIVKLIDAYTGKITYGRRGLANSTLKMKFTKISPGETIFMQTYLYKEQIESFKEKKVNITVEFIIKARIGIDDSPELTEYQGSSTIRIIEKNNRGAY